MRSWVTNFSLTAISNSKDKHKRIQTEQNEQNKSIQTEGKFKMEVKEYR